jgi:hypothetical protein
MVERSMKRRRYDTAALVGDLRRERRNAILLSLLGVAILAFLIIYFAKIHRSSVPEVPKPSDPVAMAPPKPTPVVAPTPPPPPPKPVDAQVVVTMAKAGPIFLDGELVVKKAKEHEVKVAPGKHKVSTKAGKKTIVLELEAVAGKKYRVDFDAKKKKGAVEEVAP